MQNKHPQKSPKANLMSENKMKWFQCLVRIYTSTD